MLAGIVILALPITVIGSKFSEVLAEMEQVCGRFRFQVLILRTSLVLISILNAVSAFYLCLLGSIS